MLDLRSARERALRRAIETGRMPNMDVIHARQKMEGFEACFGRAEGACHQTHCKWHAECQALASFKPVRGLGHRPGRRLPPANVTRATFGGFCDGAAPSNPLKDGPEQVKKSLAQRLQDQTVPVAADELRR